MENMSLICRGVCVCTCVLVFSLLWGQSAVNLKAGLLYKQFADEPRGHLHHGQSIGLDVLVEDTRLLFMPGLHYQQIAVRSTLSRDGVYARRPHYHQIHLPVSLGTWLAAGQYAKFRVYGGGHLSFVAAVDNSTTGPTIDQVILVHPGWQAGLQVMLWRVTAEARYVYDYRPVITQRERSRMHGWEVFLGIAL